MSAGGTTSGDIIKDKRQKTSKSRRETAVQGTNDNSIVSKCSMALHGYVDDPYLQAFVTKITRRAPLIHRGYYIRAKTIDFLLNQFFEKNSGRKQVISLGAGFDSAYFRLRSHGLSHDVVFYEVDFEEVVKRKASLIKLRPDILELIGEINTTETDRSPLIELAARNYKLLGVDLTRTNTLEAVLKRCDIDFDAPTLLLSECTLTYMTRRCASTVVQWAAETFGNSVFVIYEQINPDDAFGLFMQHHFHSVGSPLKSINSFPTMQAQKDRFISLGWCTVEAMDMNQFYYQLLSNEERNRVEHLEPFDEYEEWHLSCAHYMVLCGYHGNVAPLLTEVTGKPVENLSRDIVVQSSGIRLEYLAHDQPLRRFGHGSVVVGNHKILTVGGFGEQNGKHMRVTDLVFTDLVTMEAVVDPGVSDKDIEVSRMHSTISLLKDGRVILIGGRMSPMKLCSQTVFITMDHVTSNQDWERMLKNGRHFIDAKNVERCKKINSVDRKKHSAVSAVNSEKEVKSAMNCENESATNCENRENNIASAMNCESSPHIEGGQVMNIYENVVGNCANENLDLISCDRPNSKCESGSVIIHPIASIVENFDGNSKNETDICANAGSAISPIENSIQENNDRVNKGSELQTKDKVEIQDMGAGTCSSDGQNEMMDDSSRVEVGPAVSCCVVQPTGDVPAPRWRHTAVVCDMAGEEAIVMFGGRSQNILAMNDCYAYTPRTNTWAELEISENVPDARQSHAACVWRGHMIISGGLGSDLQPLTSVMQLDLQTLAWSKMSCKILPRYSHTAHVVRDYMVLVGGVSFSHTILGIAIVHLPSGKSMEFALPKTEKANLVMLHKHTSVAIDDHRILLIGGGGNCFSFGTHLNSSPIVLDISEAIQMMDNACV